MNDGEHRKTQEAHTETMVKNTGKKHDKGGRRSKTKVTTYLQCLKDEREKIRKNEKKTQKGDK